MSTAQQLQQNYRETKARLLNPPNGRRSDEREVVSEREWQKLLVRNAQREIELKARAEEERAYKEQLAKWAEEGAAMRRGWIAREMAQFDPTRRITLASITLAVCTQYRLTRAELFCHRRNVKLVRPRQIVAYLAHKHTAKSFPEISAWCGNRDHTTAMHSVRRIRAMLDNCDIAMGMEIARIEQMLGVE